MLVVVDLILSQHPQEMPFAEHTPASFFAQERRRALIGVAVYLLAALVALWQPVAGLRCARSTPWGSRPCSAEM